jgi:hypothetical protein
MATKRLTAKGLLSSIPFFEGDLEALKQAGLGWAAYGQREGFLGHIPGDVATPAPWAKKASVEEMFRRIFPDKNKEIIVACNNDSCLGGPSVPAQQKSRR